jgi:hypothetical protein
MELADMVGGGEQTVEMVDEGLKVVENPLFKN